MVDGGWREPAVRVEAGGERRRGHGSGSSEDPSGAQGRCQPPGSPQAKAQSKSRAASGSLIPQGFNPEVAKPSPSSTLKESKIFLAALCLHVGVSKTVASVLGTSETCF